MNGGIPTVIVDLAEGNAFHIIRVAALLVEGFKGHPRNPGPEMDSALDEVHSLFGEKCISRIAVDDENHVPGWIGGMSRYRGHVWEVHPLVVKPGFRRRGIGRALVADLEERVRKRGGLTLWAGSDDEDDMTTLAGIDLFPNPLGHLSRIRNLRGHPYEFYLKVGFAIAGVLPDANGFGKPDIFLAKSIGRR